MVTVGVGLPAHGVSIDAGLVARNLQALCQPLGLLPQLPRGVEQAAQAQADAGRADADDHQHHHQFQQGETTRNVQHRHCLRSLPMPASVCADDETKAAAVAASVGVHERGDGAGHGQALGSQSAVDRAGSDAAAGGSGLLDGAPVCGGARGGGQRSACRGRCAAGWWCWG
ncbi:hypothetical protein G6F56_013532 [Rhizopus delemar]|nr:hypothetical protein G6F56_013532 [Rhizopus delemar]